MYSNQKATQIRAEIALLLRLKWTKKRIAKFLFCSEQTVSRHSKKSEVVTSKRCRIHQMVAKRRQIVCRLAEMRKKVGDQLFPSFPTAGEIAAELFRTTKIKATVGVVRRDLSCSGMTSYVRKYDPTRDPKHVINKKRFAKKMLARSPAYLKRLCFSDEHTVSLNDHTSRRMYARSRSRVLGREKKRIQNTPHVMIWGCVGRNYKSRLVFVDRKVEEDGTIKTTMTGEWYKRHCLQPSIPEMLRRKLIFQQDGARPHVKACVLTYMMKKKLQRVLDWPAYAPDLSPIENLWAVINHRVSKLRPTNLDELRTATQKVWDEITLEECTAFQSSFASLCRKYLGLPSLKRQRQKNH